MARNTYKDKSWEYYTTVVFDGDALDQIDYHGGSQINFDNATVKKIFNIAGKCGYVNYEEGISDYDEPTIVFGFSDQDADNDFYDQVNKILDDTEREDLLEIIDVY